MANKQKSKLHSKVPIYLSHLAYAVCLILSQHVGTNQLRCCERHTNTYVANKQKSKLPPKVQIDLSHLADAYAACHSQHVGTNHLTCCESHANICQMHIASPKLQVKDVNDFTFLKDINCSNALVHLKVSKGDFPSDKFILEFIFTKW